MKTSQRLLILFYILFYLVLTSCQVLVGPIPGDKEQVLPQEGLYVLTFSPAPGTYTTATTVNIAVDPADGIVHYTTNGSTPTCASSTTLPIDVSSSMLIQAVACDDAGALLSEMKAGNYIIDTSLYHLAINPPAGTYPAVEATITVTPTDGTIHYTTDGKTPTCLSATTLPIVLTDDTILQVVACDAMGTVQSLVASVNYVVDNKFYISTSTGNDTTGYGTKANPFKTLGKAYSLAISGSDFYVAQGVYAEALYIDAKNLNIYGGYNPAFSQRNAVLYPAVINPGTTSAYAISMTNASTVLIEGFIIYGGSGFSTTYGVEIIAGSLGILQHNVISGGFGTSLSVAINQANAGTSSLVKNNFILGGKGAVSKGFYLYFSTDRIYNNTIFAGTGATAHGIDVGFKAKPKIANNIIFGIGNPGYGILESNSGNNDGSPALFQNNNISGFGSGLYYDDDGIGVLTLVADLNDYTKTTQVAGNPSSGNIGDTVVTAFSTNSSIFTNLKGSDGDVSYWDTGSQNWSLLLSTSCEIKQGGLDGNSAGWGMTMDYYLTLRTASLTCSPTNTGAAGWSMGAMEQDV